MKEEFLCGFYLSEDNIKMLKDRLSKVEGQVRGIQKMIEEGRDCNEILIQINAAKSALYAIAHKLLELHIEHCVKPSVKEGNMEYIDEFLEMIKRITR